MLKVLKLIHSQTQVIQQLPQRLVIALYFYTGDYPWLLVLLPSTSSENDDRLGFGSRKSRNDATEDRLPRLVKANLDSCFVAL